MGVYSPTNSMENKTTLTGSVSLVIGGMSCGHCVGAPSRAFSTIPGVRVRAVNVGSATIEGVRGDKRRGRPACGRSGRGGRLFRLRWYPLPQTGEPAALKLAGFSKLAAHARVVRGISQDIPCHLRRVGMNTKRKKVRPSSEQVVRRAACACAAKVSAETSPPAELDGIGPGAHAVGVDPAIKESNLTHLRRIEGQVRGIAAMVQDDRYCADIITQVMAVRESLNSVARNLMRNHLRHCASAALRELGPGRDQMIEEILDLSTKLSR